VIENYLVWDEIFPITLFSSGNAEKSHNTLNDLYSVSNMIRVINQGGW
jgi:methyl coenzyme M reductase subunit D